MKYLKRFNESSQENDLKETLNDIFLEVSDVGDWFVHVDEYSTVGKTGKDYEIYISFGDSQPYLNRDYEGVDDYGYKQKEIPTDTIDCIKRAIDFMTNEGYHYKILFCTEYSSDPGEDVISKIEIDDLYQGMPVSENEAIRIEFEK